MLGDPVNVAARLEELNKELRHPRAACPAIPSMRCRRTIRWSAIGDVAIRGKREPVRVYRLDLRRRRTS